MGILEPALTIAKKLQHGVEEETSFLLIKKQQQEPFIKQFSVELEFVDAEYFKIHSLQEALLQ